MVEKLIQEYQHIEKLLDDNLTYYLNHNFITMLAKSAEEKNAKLPSEADCADPVKHHLFQMTFSCLKCNRIRQLAMKGEPKYESHLSDTLDTLVYHVSQYMNRSKEDRVVLTYVKELLFLFVSDQPQDFPGTYYQLEEIFQNTAAVDTIEFLQIAIQMADCLKESGYEEACVTVYENLCLIFLRRVDITENQDLAVDVVLYALKTIGNLSPDASFRIALAYEDIFMDQMTAAAGDFYWYLGLASFALKKEEEGTKYLRKSIEIRSFVFGEDSLYAISMKCELILKRLEMRSSSSEKQKEDIAYLCQVIDAIEDRCMESDMNIISWKTLEGQLLFAVLSHRGYEDLPSKSFYYLSLFEKICMDHERYHCMIISPRVAKNLRGFLLMQFENYIGAEKYLKEALQYDAVVDSSREFLLEDTIKINLLQCYYMQNDVEQFFQLLEDLHDLLDQQNNSHLPENDRYRFLLLFLSSFELRHMEGVEEQDIEWLKRAVDETGNDIYQTQSSLGLEQKEKINFFVNGIFMFAKYQLISHKDATKYLDLLLQMKTTIFSIPLILEKKVMFLYTLSLLAFKIHHPQTERYILEMLNCLSTGEISQNLWISIYQLAAFYYFESNKGAMAISYIEKACDGIADIWQGSVKCLNDARLIHLLGRAQQHHYMLYTMQRELLNKEACYESILKYKFLASLAGRERNRILQLGNIEKTFMSRIRKKQNDMAQLQSVSADFYDENLHQKTAKELRLLEAEFSEQFSEVDKFTDISLHDVMEHLPDHTAVVEYFDTDAIRKGNIGDTSLEECADPCIDVYILKKTKGTCTLDKKVISDSDKIFATAKKLISCYQDLAGNNADLKQLEEMENGNRYLYDKLIGDVEEQLSDVNVVYFAPCNLLVNLPFGLLKKDNGVRLSDTFVIAKMECARDVLYISEDGGSNLWDHTLVMGDPEFDIKEKENQFSKNYREKNDTMDQTMEGDRDAAFLNDSDKTRRIDFKNLSLSPLPFSGIEALRIGKRLEHADCFVGIHASKKRLLEAHSYTGIHLATHGIVDYKSHRDTLYSSCILLAGAGNWMKKGWMDESLGNGIVTADEISRQNWRHVKLVVLSSCMSGMNHYTLNKEFNGMVSALSAAGVSFVICSLWNQSDLATAVLMEEFYRCYIEGCMPYEALKKAQHYLKNVTIQDLKKKGWFQIPDMRLRSLTDPYVSFSDRRKPFRNEIYWGGFECIRCN